MTYDSHRGTVLRESEYLELVQAIFSVCVSRLRLDSENSNHAMTYPGVLHARNPLLSILVNCSSSTQIAM